MVKKVEASKKATTAGNSFGRMLSKETGTWKPLKNDSEVQRRWYQPPKQGLVYGSASLKRNRLEQKSFQKRDLRCQSEKNLRLNLRIRRPQKRLREERVNRSLSASDLVLRGTKLVDSVIPKCQYCLNPNRSSRMLSPIITRPTPLTRTRRTE